MGIISRNGKENGERHSHGNHGGNGTTIIASGTRLDGDLTLSGNLHVDGRIEGDIRSEADVAIGRSGEFQGDISASNVVVSGVVHGSISCQRLEIVADGRVDGDVETNQLVIEAGGQFSGASRIKDQKAPRQLAYQEQQTAAEDVTASESAA